MPPPLPLPLPLCPAEQVCRLAGVPLIINDRLDVALMVGADGVHVGQVCVPQPCWWGRREWGGVHYRYSHIHSYGQPAST